MPLLIKETVAHGWVVLSDAEMELYCLGDECPNMGFLFKNAMVTVYKDVDQAINYAREYYADRKVNICLMGFDTATCLNSINAVLSGGTHNVQAICKEFFKYPAWGNP